MSQWKPQYTQWKMIPEINDQPVKVEQLKKLQNIGSTTIYELWPIFLGVDFFHFLVCFLSKHFHWFLTSTDIIFILLWWVVNDRASLAVGLLSNWPVKKVWRRFQIKLLTSYNIIFLNPNLTSVEYFDISANIIIFYTWNFTVAIIINI